MSDSATYDNTGSSYNVTRILTPEFSLAAYKANSPLPLNNICYVLRTVIRSHSIFDFIHLTQPFGKQIWQQFRNSTTEEPDTHMKMMQMHREAPTWWYMSLFSVMIEPSLITVFAFPTNLSKRSSCSRSKQLCLLLCDNY